MIKDGLFDKFPVDAVFGLHNWPGMAVGKAAVSAGPVMVLAFLAIIGGFLNLPFQKLEFLTHFLEPVFEGIPAPEPTGFWSAFGLDIVAVVIAFIGIGFAWSLYRNGLEDPADLIEDLGRALNRSQK